MKTRAGLYLVLVRVLYYRSKPGAPPLSREMLSVLCGSSSDSFMGEQTFTVYVVAFTQTAAEFSALEYAQLTAAQGAAPGISVFAERALAAVRLHNVDCIGSSVIEAI